MKPTYLYNKPIYMGEGGGQKYQKMIHGFGQSIKMSCYFFQPNLPPHCNATLHCLMI